MFDDPSISNVSIAGHALFGLQLAIGGILLGAAISKLRAPRASARALAGYILVPPNLASSFAVALVTCELFIGLSLISGRFLGVTVWLASTMLAGFLGAAALQLQRGERIPCGCFGANDMISARTLVRLALLLSGTLTLALVVFVLDVSPADPSAIAADGFDSIVYFGTISSFAAGLVLVGAWILRLDELRGLILDSAAPGRTDARALEDA